jgi:hypothetical protein
MTTDVGAQVALSIFLIGVVFYGGRLTARVEQLELWRAELRGDLASIFKAIHRLERLIKGEEDGE